MVRLSLRISLITALLVPLVILLHEFGHLIAGLAIGVHGPRISLSSFTHAPTPSLQGWQRAIMAGAGPAVSIALAITGLVARRGVSATFANSLTAAACVRLLELVPFALPALRRRLSDRPIRITTLDEDQMFRALHLPGDVGVITITIVFAILLLITLRRTPNTAPSLLIGGLAGWLAWKAVVAL